MNLFTASIFVFFSTLLELVCAQKTSKNKPFSSLVVFGDSYSSVDIESYIPAPDGSLPEEDQETASGGRSWAQYTSQYANVNAYIYAVGGAVCDASWRLNDDNGIKQQQLPRFLKDNQWRNDTNGEPALQNPPNETIYAIWIGTNDLGSSAFLTERQVPKDVSLTAYTDCVFDQLDRLHEVGARRFAILNLAPLDLLPQYGLAENGGLESTQFWEDKLDYNRNITQISEKMRQYKDLLNDVYKYQTPYQVKLTDRYSESEFMLFDVHSLIKDMWDDPEAYLNGTAPTNKNGFVTDCAESTCSDKSDWDSFLWYDELHPSEQTHRIVAKEFVDVVGGTSKYADYWFS